MEQDGEREKPGPTMALGAMNENPPGAELGHCSVQGLWRGRPAIQNGEAAVTGRIPQKLRLLKLGGEINHLVELEGGFAWQQTPSHDETVVDHIKRFGPGDSAEQLPNQTRIEEQR
jgi:hypothetical protein